MSLTQLADTIERRSVELRSRRIVTGFDGFIDELISVVESRQSSAEYNAVDTISRFAELLAAAAGHSSLREAVVTAIEPGGCAVNMGDGLAALGVAVDTFATLGEPIHPAFSAYGRVAHLHSWGAKPGRTLAFEFSDGKLMFSDVAHLADFTVEHVARHLAEGDYARACSESSLIALTDWSLYPHMTAVWRRLSEEVFTRLETRRPLLIDLVDPSGRSESDIRSMLEVVSELAAAGDVTLGLNQNEANVLASVLDLEHVAQADPQRSAAQAAALRDRLAVQEVLLHTHRFATVATPETDPAVTAGPYTPAPVKSTGAGDRFNAGYATGLVLGLPPIDRLRLAVATGGAFVRQARSASIAEVAALLRNASEWPDTLDFSL